MKLPCRECISLAVCKQKKVIKCELVNDYSFLHDHDPGDRGALARCDYVASFLFGDKGHQISMAVSGVRRSTIIRITEDNK